MKRILLISLVALFVLSSCNKWQHRYPEDTERTKDSPTKRLTNKWWTLESATVNGIDYTDSVKLKLGVFRIFFSTEYRIEFNGDKVFYGRVHTDSEPEFTSGWQFPDESSIIIGAMNSSHEFNQVVVPCFIVTQDNDHHTILKLSQSEFKISTNWGNGYIISNLFRSN